MSFLKKSILYITIFLIALSMVACKDTSDVPAVSDSPNGSVENTDIIIQSASDMPSVTDLPVSSISNSESISPEATASADISTPPTQTASVAASPKNTSVVQPTATASVSAATSSPYNSNKPAGTSKPTNTSKQTSTAKPTSSSASAVTSKATTTPKKTSQTATAATPKPTASSGIKSSEQYIEFLNNNYKNYQEVEYGLDITKKTDLVGICYSTWFTAIHAGNGRLVNSHNITDILEGNGTWGSAGQFHYWAEPALGYYTSHDESVIRTHMTQIAEMGADYIIIDNTNVQMQWQNNQDWFRFVTRPCTALLDTIVEMRAEGLETPYVVFWNKTSDGQNWDVVNEIYDEFISVEKWKDCFVYWEGKPFVLITSKVSGTPDCDITTRVQWGLKQSLGTSEWSFLNITNVPSVDANRFAEQICVCTAVQETYMSDTTTAHGRNHGIFMYNQWKNAFKYRPKAITLTWWNEWCAQLSYSANGTPQFVDNYNQEYSRDIEPMKGGHGDQYYQWTKQYITAYKNHSSCPRLVEAGY